MSIKISKAQRWLLVGLAAIIAIILFEQIDDEGLDETPWLIGSLIIGALLFFAIAPSSEKPRGKESTQRSLKRNPTPKRKPATKEQLRALSSLADAIPKIDERYAPVEQLYQTTVREWSDFFSSSVVDRLAHMSRSDMGHMRKFSQLAAISMSFANLIFFIKGEQAKTKNEDLKIDAHVARILATKDLSAQIQYTLETGPAVLTPEQRHPEVLRSLAMKKLEAYELAVNESMQRYIDSVEFPFDPLFEAIDKEAHFKIPDAESREDFFGIKFREELGRLVRDAKN